MENILLKLKKKLEQKPDNIIFGKINEGNLFIKEKGVYYNFLRIADGIRCGIIDLWSYNDILRNQYMIADKEKWLCIGQANYMPLMLQRKLNNVYVYDENNEDDKQWILISDFNHFIMNYVLGDSYAVFNSSYEEDLWYQFIIAEK